MADRLIDQPSHLLALGPLSGYASFVFGRAAVDHIGLAGIGCTMSLFVASLALEDSLLEAGKLGTLVGSAFSAIIRMCVLWASLARPQSGGKVAATTASSLQETDR